MARLWSSGFELQSVVAGVEFYASNGTGSKSIDTTTKRSGAASLRYNPTTDYWFMSHQFRSGGTSKVFARVYFKVASLPASDYVSFFGLGIGETSTATGAQVRLATDGTLQLGYFNAGFSVVDTDTTNVNDGNWHRLELSYDDTTDAAEVLLDGVSIMSGSTTDLGGFDQLFLGSLYDSDTLDIYFDDVAINDASGSYQTSWPGEGKIIHLKPNADGDNHAWLKSGGSAGDANNYQDVDEITPDDATTYLKRTTGQPTDDYNVEASGIGASDTVSLVSVGVRAKATSNTASTNRNIILRIKKTASGTVASSGNIDFSTTAYETHQDPNPKVYQLTKYHDPDGAAWTQSTLDTMQIGMIPQTSSTTEIDVSTLWALVEYVVVESSGTNMQLNIGDTWKTVSGLQVNIGDTWKTVTSVKINIGDSWKTIF